MVCAIGYSGVTVLALFCLIPSTPVTVDLLASFAPTMTSASEYLYSSSGRYPPLNYGSSRDYEMVGACFVVSGSIVSDFNTLSCH